MNNYKIVTTSGSFSVEGEDSDMAAMAANTEAVERLIPSQTAVMYLVRENGEEKRLGKFELDGICVPRTWSDIKELKSELWNLAKEEAYRTSPLKVIRSRSAVLVVRDANGKDLITTGDNFTLASSYKGLKKDLARIKADFPSAHFVEMVLGCNSAQSIRDMNDGNCEPWTGEASSMLHIFGSEEQGC
jgi:hypothetical protein